MKILTAKELSEILQIKRKTLYQWADEGKIPSFKIGGSVRFNYADIENFIKAQTSQKSRKGGRRKNGTL